MELLDFENLVCDKFLFVRQPIYDLELLTADNKNLYVSRLWADGAIENYCKSIWANISSNIMISGRAGIGKTTFVHFFFTVLNPQFHYIRINMAQFFRRTEQEEAFLENDFYMWLWNELSRFLRTENFHVDAVSQKDLAKDPKIHVFNILQNFFYGEFNSNLFLFIDNIDVRPKALHIRSLDSCLPLLSAPNIKVVFASRRQFTQYIRETISSEFYSAFPMIIDLNPIELYRILSARIDSVKKDGFTFPLSQEALTFLEAYSNGSLRSALRYTQTILLDAALNDEPVPISRIPAVKSLYKGKDVVRVYSREQFDDKEPIRLIVLKYFRQYGKSDGKFYSKLYRLFGFPGNRLLTVKNELIEARLFDTVPIGGEKAYSLMQITPKGGEYCKIVDDGLMYELYKEFDIPTLADTKAAYIGFEKSPWGSRFDD